MGKYVRCYPKITPFKYPYKKHIRTENPPAFTDYKKFKPFLKREFENKCVYCRKISSVLTYKGSFHVEHYRPKHIFQDLRNDYHNLFFVCALCNIYKGKYWVSEPKEHILNPCDHVMSQHLKFDEEKIVSLTDQAEITLKKLRLNDDNALKYRKLVKAAIINFLKDIQNIDIKHKLKDLNEALDNLAELIGEDKSKLVKILRLKQLYI